MYSHKDALITVYQPEVKTEIHWKVNLVSYVESENGDYQWFGSISDGEEDVVAVLAGGRSGAVWYGPQDEQKWERYVADAQNAFPDDPDAVDNFTTYIDALGLS